MEVPKVRVRWWRVGDFYKKISGREGVGASTKASLVLFSSPTWVQALHFLTFISSLPDSGCHFHPERTLGVFGQIWVLFSYHKAIQKEKNLCKYFCSFHVTAGFANKFLIKGCLQTTLYPRIEGLQSDDAGCAGGCKYGCLQEAQQKQDRMAV